MTADPDRASTPTTHIEVRDRHTGREVNDAAVGDDLAAIVGILRAELEASARRYEQELMGWGQRLIALEAEVEALASQMGEMRAEAGPEDGETDTQQRLSRALRDLASATEELLVVQAVVAEDGL